VRFALESEPQGLQASERRVFLVQWSGGLPQLAVKARARTCALALSFVLRQSRVSECQCWHSMVMQGANLSKAGRCVGLVHAARRIKM